MKAVSLTDKIYVNGRPMTWGEFERTAGLPAPELDRIYYRLMRGLSARVGELTVQKG